ncbi:peptide ABC transporter ATP-binding protein [Aureimonas endophytica]|uniref:Peptide ABC transporter ATP-binding protein n=1 Tax=Aureimonas endophytica TaxID=2027858 RepID=A0A916ZTX1_9HYPH|nr:DMT family transporter [Aureimonas endophytica]GGE13993.1 peptide ABC transporter ATP-binding protein [Aureimonas endophytica]
MPRLLSVIPALFVLLWSTGFIGARYAMPHSEPFTFLALRFFLALLLLAPFALARRARWPARGPALHAAFVGALIHGLYLGGVFSAVRHGLPAGIAALIAGLQPLLTAFLAGGMLGETVAPRQWFGLLLGLLGTVLVIEPRLAGASGFGAPALLAAFGGMAAISLGTIWQKRHVAGVDLVTGTTLQYLGALVPAGLFALLFEEGRIDWTPEFVFALVWLVLVLSIGAIFILLYMIREGAVSRVTSLLYLVPGTTAVMAFLLFGERLLPIQLLGLCLSGLGVAAATRRRRPAESPVRA